MPDKEEKEKGKVIQLIADDFVSDQKGDKPADEDSQTFMKIAQEKSDQELSEEDMLVAQREVQNSLPEVAVNTETIEQRKQRTIIVMCQDATMLKQIVDEVGKRNNAFVVIADQEIFDETFAKFVSSSIEPEINGAIEDYLNNPEKIKLAKDLAMTIGTVMGFDREFRVNQLTNFFAWKYDEAKERMSTLVEFGFAFPTPNGNGQFFSISLDFEKRREQFIIKLKEHLSFVSKQFDDLKNVMDAEQKKALNDEVQILISKEFGYDLKKLNDIMETVEREMEESDCSFLQAMINVEKKEAGEFIEGGDLKE
jgi:hypothetical protein